MVGTTGQIQKVTRLENPRCPAMVKTGKQGPCSQEDLTSPRISLVMWFRTPDFSYRWSRRLDPLGGEPKKGAGE